LLRASGARERLPGRATVSLAPGDRLRIETPGGGGWGSPRALPATDEARTLRGPSGGA
jgi:N-methylhydantoinase B/oxoprolinase/acetone carboxylase alpha subunit